MSFEKWRIPAQWPPDRLNMLKSTQPIRLEPEMPPQATVPSRVIRPASPPQPPVRQAAPRPRPQAPPKTRSSWWLIAPLALIGVLMVSTCAALTLGAGLIYGRGVLPQVSVAGVNLGGLSESAAAAALQSEWQSLTLRDGERTWNVNPADLGISLDAQASAERAYAQGRTAGDPLSAIFSGVDLAPVLDVDLATASATLTDLAPRFEIAPVNAGLRFANGQIETTPPQEGRQLNLDALLDHLQTNLSAEIADGVLDLPMYRVEPSVTDAEPMLNLASDLLAKPLQITLFDPIENSTANWSLPPEQWSQWLTATSDSNSRLGWRWRWTIRPCAIS